MSESPPSRPPENTASEQTATGPMTGGLQLGTFLGVYTPTVLTILGVILYLRLGWVVGNAGLLGALLIVVLAHVITMVTALSMSSLATNMRVGVGGAYFLISRSVGLEVGGAVGIPLFLSQAISVTLYAFGLAESIRVFWDGAPVQPLAAIIVVGVGLVASKSTELALKLQVPILVFVGISLVCFFSGVEWGTAQGPRSFVWEDAGFWVVFAVFFPAVTGILAGVSLSGDLKDANRSIPLGAGLAILTGFLVYLLVPIGLFHAASGEALRENPLIWVEISPFAVPIVLGLWGAILSSALGSILSAPRTLQALAWDGLAPSMLGESDEKTGEPKKALWLSWAIALAAVLLGDLNAVAVVVTMFFLTTYATVNLVAALEGLVGDPSFRPRIRCPWWVALAGCVFCAGAMFLIHPIACISALVTEVAIWLVIRRRALRATWGDVRTGLWFTLAQYGMLKLRDARHDPRNWRPHILVFTAHLERNLSLVRMAANFGQNRGIITVNTLLIGDIEDHESVVEMETRNNRLLNENGVLAFSEVASVPAFDAGVVTVAQANGFAGLASNMVMFGWPGSLPSEGGLPEATGVGDEDSQLHRLGRLLGLTRKLAGLEKSTMIMRPIPGSRKKGRKGVIIWWKGREHNGDLMLLLAHLLTFSRSWRKTPIILKSVVADEVEAQSVREAIERGLPDTRINARVDVVIKPPDRTVAEVIRHHSGSAELLFLGLALPDPGAETDYARSLADLLEGLPSAILVRNAGPFRGRLI